MNETQEIIHLFDSLFDKYKDLFSLKTLANPNWHKDIFSYKRIRESSQLMNEERAMIPPNNVQGWLEHIKNSIDSRRASPKNIKWFKKNHVFSGYPEVGVSTCPDFEQIEKQGFCSRCSRGTTTETLFPNNAEECIESLIERFCTAADKAVSSNGDLGNSRFVLSGKAGEGKTEWINYLLSVKQDFSWERRLITIRVNITDGNFHKKFKEILKKYGTTNTDQQDFLIRDWINLKIIRILKEFYLSCKTTICVEKNFKALIPKDDKLLGCKFEKSRDEEEGYFLSYEGGPMAKVALDSYLQGIPSDSPFYEAMKELYHKSQKTLTYAQRDQITQKVNDSVADDENYGNLLEPFEVGYGRERTESIDPRIATAAVSGMINFRFRFLIILDGLDPHDNYEASEKVTAQIVRQSLALLFRPKVLMLPAAYLLVVRTETIDRHILVNSFPGSQWKGIQRLRFNPTDIYPILEKRLSHASEKFGNVYYKEMYKYFLNICTHHIGESLGSRSLSSNQQILNSNVPLDDLALLFRQNRRVILQFFYLYMTEIYLALKRYGILTESETDEKKYAVVNALKYYHSIAKRSYLFWNAVIYRGQTTYSPIYNYKYPDKNEAVVSDLHLPGGELIRLVPQGPGKDKYGTVPNVLDFVQYSNVGEGKLPNKVFLRLRILQVLSENPQRYTFLLREIREYFEIPEDDVYWEIDAMVAMGLIESCSEGQSADIGEDPLLQSSDFWKFYRNHFLNRDLFCGLIAAIPVPNNKIFYLNKYMTFVGVGYGVNDRDGYKLMERKRQAYTTEFIMADMMVAYLVELESEERKRYEACPNKLAFLVNDNDNVSFDIFSIKNELEAVRESIRNFSGVYNEESISEKVRDDLRSRRSVIDAEITTVKRRCG